MGIRSKRTEPSQVEHPVYRYGMLIVVLVLLVWQTRVYLSLPSSYDGDPYGGYVVLLMLLFNHLASAFKWPKGIATALWVLAWSWIIFSLFYILILSGIWGQSRMAVP